MPDTKPEFSVVVPVRDEEGGLRALSEALSRAMEDLGPWELILVDDGSADDSAGLMRSLAASDPRIGYVILSRNFGKEAAILAGLSSSSGRAVVVMDADLQHPPSLIPEMAKLWRSGAADIVDGVKRGRGSESRTYRAAAGLFNRLVSPRGGSDMRGSSDFKLLDRRIVDILVAFPERIRFFRGLTEWAGFRHAAIGYDVEERSAGKSAWTLRGLASYSLSSVAAFSAAPLHAIAAFGALAILFAVALGAQTLYMKLAGKAVEGFTTVILAVAFFSGATIFSLGIIGAYLARMYDELKGRPAYLVADRRRPGEKA